jgi:hypothetical protein
MRFTFVSALFSAALVSLCLLASAPAHAQHLQLEAGLNGYVPSLFAVMPRVGFGVVLSDHLVLGSGVSGGVNHLHNHTNAIDMRSVYVPLELVAYLRAPRAGIVSPTLRAGAGYDYARSHQQYRAETGATVSGPHSHEHGLTAQLLGGATYFVSPSFGVGVELGAELLHVWAGPTTMMSGTQIGALSRLNIIMRI